MSYRFNTLGSELEQISHLYDNFGIKIYFGNHIVTIKEYGIGEKLKVPEFLFERLEDQIIESDRSDGYWRLMI